MSTFTLKPEKVQFLMIELQERVLPAISGHDKILRNSIKLAKAAGTFNIPFKYTEQYPRGLGKTVKAMADALPEDAERFEKMHFCCMDEPGFEVFINDPERDQVVILGNESHICVLSTAMVMMEKGLKVAVAVDACGSRLDQNHRYAMDTLGRNGALVLPTESIIYQLLGRAGTPEFKELLPLFKDPE